MPRGLLPCAAAELGLALGDNSERVVLMAAQVAPGALPGGCIVLPWLYIAAASVVFVVDVPWANQIYGSNRHQRLIWT